MPTVSRTFTVEHHDSGSEIAYEAVIEMETAAGKLVSPVVTVVFETIGSDT